MVEAKACVFFVEEKLDRLNTEWRKYNGMTAVSICRALNESQFRILKQKAKEAEMNKDLRHVLLPLEEKEVFVPVKSSKPISIIKFPEAYFRDLGIRIVANKRDCGKKEIALTKMDTNDKGTSLSSPFWKSSYAWEQVFGDEGREGFFIYNGVDFKVDGMIIDYYKRPPEIHAPSCVAAGSTYVDWNGKKHTDDVGWTLDDLIEEGINLACQILARNIGDQNDYQLQVSNNQQADQISKQ